jgi:hypothetical protein
LLAKNLDKFSLVKLIKYLLLELRKKYSEEKSENTVLVRWAENVLVQLRLVQRKWKGEVK